MVFDRSTPRVIQKKSFARKRRAISTLVFVRVERSRRRKTERVRRWPPASPASCGTRRTTSTGDGARGPRAWDAMTITVRRAVFPRATARYDRKPAGSSVGGGGGGGARTRRRRTVASGSPRGSYADPPRHLRRPTETAADGSVTRAII